MATGRIEGRDEDGRFRVRVTLTVREEKLPKWAQAELITLAAALAIRTHDLSMAVTAATWLDGRSISAIHGPTKAKIELYEGETALILRPKRADILSEAEEAD